MDAYKPSKSFWREIKQADNVLFDLAKIEEKDSFGPIPIRTRQHIWMSDTSEQASPIIWRADRTRLMGIFVSTLCVCEVIESSATPDIGAFARTTAYSTVAKRARVNALLFPNVNESYREYDLDVDDELEKVIGTSSITKDDYEQLLYELHRGVSGDFSMKPKT